MLTCERLRELLDYDPSTGKWIWKIRRQGVWPGRYAGTPVQDGRFQIRIDRIKYYSAPLAWLYMTGEWPPETVDHINRICTDDRWENLRLATRSENATNSNRWERLKVSSLPRGVHKVNNGYQARISVNCERKHIGFFKTPEEAHAAYLKASEFRAEFLP
jgi:HNH endonuclease